VGLTVTLGMDIAAALPELRANAESLMTDTCVVTNTTPGAWDDATGTYGAPVVTNVYTGRCQLAKTEPSASDSESGEATWVSGATMLKLPMTLGPDDTGDPLAVTTGHTVSVTSRGNLALSVRFAIPQTFEKSRKVACERVTRDA